MGKNHRRNAIKNTLAQLVERYPRAFVPSGSERPTLPLKVGIAGDVIRENPDLRKPLVVVALNRYCRKHRYLVALVEGATRVDLEGFPAGEVSARDAAQAVVAVAQCDAERAAWIEGRKERRAAKRAQQAAPQVSA